MGELNINDLPCEILGNILQFLDGVDLKKATLACRLWNNVIESECRWSFKLDYNMAYNEEEKMNFIMMTNRKFGTILIEYGRLNEDKEIFQIFQRHGSNVFKLTLIGWYTDNLSDVAELLNLTPNVNHVHLQMEIAGNVSDTQLIQLSPELKKLKRLDLDVNDQRIVQCFRKAKLKTIRIFEDAHREQYVPSLLDFMLSQNTLTSLFVDIGYRQPSILVGLGKLNVPFRLTKFGITGGIPLSERANVLRFIKSQARNLVELEIKSGFLTWLSECIIESMPKLNILSLIYTNGFHGIDNDFYEGMEVNCSVRTIKLLRSGCVGREDQFLHEILKKLPNVRSVVLRDCCYFNEIDPSSGKIEFLALRFCEDEYFFDSVQSSNLKTLHIQSLQVKIDWNKFTKANPLLTELIIEKMGREWYLTSDDIDQMTTNVDLQQIRLGVGFVADDRFFEIIRTKCTNLKVLDLDKSCLPHGLTDNVGINVLRLCHDIRCSKTFRTMLLDW